MRYRENISERDFAVSQPSSRHRFFPDLGIARSSVSGVVSGVVSGSPTGRTNSSHSGQAIIEYILILLVIVVILLSTLWKLSSSYRAYTTNLFGSYFACLLETGEVPSQAGGLCASTFKPFSTKDGIEKGRFGAAGDGAPAANRAANRPVQNYSGGGGSGNNRGETVGGSGFASRGSGGRPAVASAGQGKEDGKSNSNSLSLAPGVRGSKQIGRSSSNGKDRVIASGFGEDEEGGKNKNRPTSKKVGEASESVGGLKKGKFVSQFKPKGPDQKIEDDTTQFSFGGLLRLFLIVCIILALVIFIGGQFMQISKSMEKN
jgi:hypothetical protein